MFQEYFGYNQIITYGFISKNDFAKVYGKNEELESKNINVLNYLSKDYEIMRQSLVPSMLNTIKFNENKNNLGLKLFEISKTYINNMDIENGKLPLEEENLIMAMTTKSLNQKAMAKFDNMNYEKNPIFVFKSEVFKLLNSLGLNGFVFEQTEDKIYHPRKICSYKKRD